MFFSGVSRTDGVDIFFSGGGGGIGQFGGWGGFFSRPRVPATRWNHESRRQPVISWQPRIERPLTLKA